MDVELEDQARGAVMETSLSYASAEAELDRAKELIAYLEALVARAREAVAETSTFTFQRTQGRR